MKRIKVLIVAVMMTLMLLTVVFTAHASEADTSSWDIKSIKSIKVMLWEEKKCPDSNSKRDPFVRETGLVLSFGKSLLSRPAENFLSRLDLIGFIIGTYYQGGKVENGAPKDMATIWGGAAVEEALGYKVKISKDLSVVPFVALGFSPWIRTAGPEIWFTVYEKAGIEIREGELHVKAGLIVPSFSKTYVEKEGVSWLNKGEKTKFTTNPKGEITPFVEIGFRNVNLFFEMKEWDASDVETLRCGVTHYQPRTVQFIFGINWYK